MKKIVTGLLAVLLSTSLWAKEPLKIGFVYVSPVGDAGWTYQHDLGRQAIEKEFGKKIEVKYLESISEGPDAERVLRKLASDGYGLIFSTSFGFMNPTIKVAKTFPKVTFEHATGYKTAKNMGNYSPRFYEGRYLAGIAAGSETKSGVIGYVAAFPIPEVIRGINAFTLGAQSVNPKTKVKVIWTSSWFNPSKEAEASLTLIAQGADILTHHTDSVAIVATAKEKGVKAIAYHSDMQNHGGKAQIGAVVHYWDKFYTNKVNQVLNNTWKSSSLWQGLKEDLVDFKVTSNLDKKIVAKINTQKTAIAKGNFHPFTGPIKDQNGKVVAKKGQVLSDGDLQGMNYFVAGVAGKVK